jgi:anhydro-N-acetylmuramic acid kinase
MDAIDAALVDFESRPIRVIAASATGFTPALRDRLDHLSSAEAPTLDEFGRLDVEIGRAFAAAAIDLLRGAGVGPEAVAAIGSHGQTVRHQPVPPAPFTLQIGDPNTLAELTGITVVADFRRRDVAAGGQGAPLVPVFHDQAFRSDTEDRVIANIGGIANITVLRRAQPLGGFDTGPGNRLLDAWILRQRGLPFDRDGAWAAQGQIDPRLLERLLGEPYLRLPPPKSTGRELFNLAWLDEHLAGLGCAPVDVQATLQEFTAATLADAIRERAPAASVYVCGGGARNPVLLAALARRSGPQRVATTAALGLDPDYVEAVAFAWFARRTLAGETSSDPRVTGARAARILGAIYPARAAAGEDHSGERH